MTNPISPISPEQLKEILTNPDTTQHEIEELIERDSNPNLNPFNSNLKVKSQAINSNIDDEWFNEVARKYRQQKYQEKINKGFSGVKIVSEGDSWFQFPFLLKDVIDWLSDDYAIWSLDAAGDTLENMTSAPNTNKIIDVITNKNPDVFLISGGGNDMFTNGLFNTLINEFDPDIDRLPEKYLNGAFDDFVKRIMDIFKKLFTDLLRIFPDLKIVCHGYDYIIPRESLSGGFVRNSLIQMGINDEELQIKIMRVVIDRLNDAQIDLVSRFPNRVFHVDCRKAVGVGREDWFDEIHPKNDGFESVADRFKTVINRII
ncbi:hypothetical protein [Chamaesiphon sp. VAR_48_metabat_135_sub]|uniref:hypothetical protein n=1 Tax=Chamaesiphon sp. VAR_48_metabat_135_sub TaxID=2964699 RepID=UPI00286D5C4C|nr:hypothetical protein [Chamaesiphon sp. VAR_48_metabat_135_sub]